MLQTERMTKISVTGSTPVMDKVIKEFYRQKVIHIIEHRKTNQADIGMPLAKADLISEILVIIGGLMNSLKVDKNSKYSIEKYREFKLKNGLTNAEKSKKAVNNLHNYIIGLNDETKKLEEKLNVLKGQISTLNTLKNISLNIEYLSDTKTLSFFAGTINAKKDIHNQLDMVSSRYKIFSSIADGQQGFVLFFEKDQKLKFMDALNSLGFEELHLENIDVKKGTIPEAISRINSDFEKCRNSIGSSKKKLVRLRNEWENYLITERIILSKELEQLEAPLKFAATDKVFVIEGYVPNKNLDIMKERLQKITDNKIYLKTGEISKKENVPIKFDHPKNVKPFEFFMHLYTLPNYKELDPTFFLFLTFPLFFGFMLGDIGYGLITLILFLWLRRKLTSIKSLLDILVFASYSTVVFGFLFGEFFGSEEVMGYELPHILSRVHEINSLLYLAIVIGFIHINTALIIGFINEKRSHGLKHAIFAKLSWMVLEFGVIIIALSYMEIIASLPIVGYLILLLAIIMIYLGEGVAGLTELPGIFSNILSYARLMAIGVASASLAIVVNEFAFESFGDGILGIFVGILILVIGHVINIGLGLLGPFLHSLRLHYVEFFSKFYKGGGIEYKPFGD